ncbi:MAG TPA: selenoneine synthase SenA [Burkholderiales bacterium]
MTASKLKITGCEDLAELLGAARSRMLALIADFGAEQLLGPQLSIVNPPLWEIGHVGWFQEHWCLRYQADKPPRPSLLANADRLYNSAIVAHETRWNLPLPPLPATLDYIERVYDDVMKRIAGADGDADLRYFAQLAALHEEMHCEAYTYTRQTLGYAAPVLPLTEPPAAGGSWPGDVEIAGGTFMLGATPADGFVFDNEKWAHEVTLQPYCMARAPVTNAEFAAFVDAGGYGTRTCWSEEGWRWREKVQARAPAYWRRSSDTWQERVYDTYQPLQPHAPVMHVNWYEADAYCRWAGRRLPTEAEWEFAASTAPHDTARKRRYPWGDTPPTSAHANLYRGAPVRADVAAHAQGDSAWGCRQMLGNVWEWTADDFSPYPGFAPDPYKEYSAPWFGDHKVLRGGCHATRAALAHNRYRNFYTPDRRDVYAGFRTCALVGCR